MKTYTEFEVIESVRPLTIRKHDTKAGWYYPFRSIASFYFTGGTWWQFSLCLSVQIVLLIVLGIVESLIYAFMWLIYGVFLLAKYFFTKLFEATLKYVGAPILITLSLLFTCILIFATYKLNLWSQLLNYLLNFLQQWF